MKLLSVLLLTLTACTHVNTGRENYGIYFNYTKGEPELKNLQAYAIRDKKAEAFHTPFFSQNHATAIRSFESAVQTEGHEFQLHAEDYQLFALGSFDAETGELVGEAVTAIAAAMDFTLTPIPNTITHIQP